MAKSSFKLSRSLEERIASATRARKKYPDKIPVIMEKYEHSHVPNLDKEMIILAADLSVGHLKHLLRKNINLAAKEAIFVFVKNTLPPTDALMSAIYEEHKDEDGILYMTYSGEDIITELLFTTRISLDILDSMMTELEGTTFLEYLPNTWTPYLSHVEMLLAISESHKNVMEQTREILKVRLNAFCSLVTDFSRLQDRNWVFKLRDCINFKVRHHFAKMMFLHEELEELSIILDRSNVLTESFEQIADASPTSLHGDLSIYFKDEEAVGEGVLREWLCLVCEKLFQPEIKLFVRSTDDCRRFTPNSASYVHVEHLKYFRFAGRVIALALKNDVQVGVLFDPVFYLQLVGKRVSLEDIKLTDLREYNSCLKILQMSTAEFDEADLCLSFSIEIREDLKKRTEIPLCEGGNDIAVTFKNRESYINMRIENLYVTLVKDQVSQFIQGFEDMIMVPHDIFFNTLNLEDIDGLLRGKEQEAICIDDWKSYTDYVDFEENETVIKWFWKIVNSMDQERRRNLLFFWTARKYLPMGGFEDFPERLQIIRFYGDEGSFPESHTCLLQLQLRKYKTFEEMEIQLTYVTESGISSGFGKL